MSATSARTVDEAIPERRIESDATHNKRINMMLFSANCNLPEQIARQHPEPPSLPPHRRLQGFSASFLGIVVHSPRRSLSLSTTSVCAMEFGWNCRFSIESKSTPSDR